MPLGRAATVALLFGISLMNYLDRYSVSAVLNEIQAPAKPGGGGGFGLGDSEAGLISSVFVLGYLCFSPVFGVLGDRMPRVPLLFLGVVVYSIATFLSSMSAYYWQFLLFRSVVGIGEASFAVLAPTIIADLYPNPQRTTVLGIYMISLPVGSAMGFIAAGEASRWFGWRYAFRFSPVVSFFLSALLLLTVSEPLRGGSDVAANVSKLSSRNGISKPAAAAKASPGGRLALTPPDISHALPSVPENTSGPSLLRDVVSICSTPTFRWATAGAVGMVFAAGALSSWAVPSLQRFNCASQEAQAVCEANVTRIFGTSTMITGILGTFMGSQVARWYAHRDPASDSLVCAASLFLASPFLYASIYLAPLFPTATWVSIFVGTLLVCMVWAPNLSILLSITPPNQRGTASSISLLVTHLFGDSMSPLLVGWTADLLHDGGTGMSKAVALQHSLFMSVFATLFGSVCFYVASFYLPSDRAAALQVASSGAYVAVAADEVETQGAFHTQAPSRRRGFQKLMSSREGTNVFSLDDDTGSDHISTQYQPQVPSVSSSASPVVVTTNAGAR
jgi:MFS transporter, Spinster family, sphingosine-1-phosphate transporter